MEKYTIYELQDEKTLPDKVFKGLTGINVEATIDGIFDAKFYESKPGSSKQWTFWSQFILLEDGGNKIGYGYTTKEEARLLNKQTDRGKKIFIEGAVANIYTNKDGNPTRKLEKGRLSFVVEDSGGTDKGTEKVSNVSKTNGYGKSESEQVLITNSAIIKSLLEATGVVMAANKIKGRICTKDFEADFKTSSELVFGKKEKEKFSEEKNTVKETLDMDRNKMMTDIVTLYAEAKKIEYVDKEDTLGTWLVRGWEVSKVKDLTDDQMIEANSELLEALGRE